MKKWNDLLREDVADANRRLREMSSTTPQALVDEARAEARALALRYCHENQESPEIVAKRDEILRRSREREIAEYERALREGRCYKVVKGKEVYTR